MINGIGVSVLISSRDRPVLLVNALRSVLSGSELPDEVVVVDQSAQPNDGLSALVGHNLVSLRYVHSQTQGLSRSRNLAFGLASHPVIAVVDDDCLVAEDWLESIVLALVRSGPRAVVTGRVVADGDQGFAPSLHPDNKPSTFRGRIPFDPLATFNFALHAATYAAVGPFDTRFGPGTRFPAAEDNDYGYRILRMGYTIVFEPSATVYHRAWRDECSYIRLRYAYGRGQGAYYGKHLAARDWYMLWKFVHALKRRCIGMALGGSKAVAGELAWITGWTIGLIDWLARAREP